MKKAILPPSPLSSPAPIFVLLLRGHVYMKSAQGERERGKAVIMLTREEGGLKYLKCLLTSYVQGAPPFLPLFCLGLYAIRIAAGKRLVVQHLFLPLLAEWTV